MSDTTNAAVGTTVYSLGIFSVAGLAEWVTGNSGLIVAMVSAAPAVVGWTAKAVITYLKARGEADGLRVERAHLCDRVARLIDDGRAKDRQIAAMQEQIASLSEHLAVSEGERAALDATVKRQSEQMADGGE